MACKPTKGGAHCESDAFSIKTADCGPKELVNRSINAPERVAATTAMIGAEASPVLASVVNDDSGDSVTTGSEEELHE